MQEDPLRRGGPASRDLTSGARKCRLVRDLRRLSGTRVGYQPGSSNREKAPGGQPCGHRAVWEETPNVGSVRRRAEQWSPNAHPLQPRQRGPASRRRISMRRKPSHPDAEGIADDGGDENGKRQRPAAKVEIEVHRIRFASKRPQARPARKKAEPRAKASRSTFCSWRDA